MVKNGEVLKVVMKVEVEVAAVVVAVVEMQTMGVETVVLMEAKVGVKEENQEVMVKNSPGEYATQQKCMEHVPQFSLTCAVCVSVSKETLTNNVFLSFGSPETSSIQVYNQHPPTCNCYG